MEEVLLKNLPIDFIDGDRSARYPKREEFKDKGVVFLNANSISGGRFNYEGVNFISQEKFNSITKGRIKINDIILTTRGNGVGDSYFHKTDFGNGLINAQMLILRAKNENLNTHFLYYQFISNNFKSKVKNYSSGSAQPQLPISSLREIPVIFPPLQTQKRIAAILSAYDDLIENNIKRINLLEQAAQNIYKEWFVNLRFPGHEITPINEETGLPVGWTERNINEVFNIKYGKNLPATKITSSGKYSVYGASGVMGYYEECNTEIKVALITSRGNGSGDVHRTFQKNSFVTNNSFKVFPKEGYEFYPFFFVTEFLKTLNLLSYCSGSAQPQLTNASMNNIRSVFPNKEMVVLFTQKVSPILEQSDVLLKQNQKLKAARDILLPRLMNRTIEV
jgi:type I restriction enzyme S subunit